MQMCGAPPSYNQIMQLGGQPGDFDANTPVPEIQSVGNEIAVTAGVIHPSSVPNQHRMNSYDDESSEVEYLSELHFPDRNGTAPPPFGVTRSSNEVTRPEDQAEYAECNDEPPMAPPFSTSLNSATSENDPSHHFELRATNSSSSTLHSHLSSNIEDSQQQRRSSSDAHQNTSS